MILSALTWPLRWLARRMGQRKVLIMAFLLLALGSVAAGLADSVRGLDFLLLLSIAVAGMLVGWGLAVLPVRGRVAGALSCALGLGGVLVRVGRLGKGLPMLLRELFALALGVSQWSQGGPLPDWAPVVLALAEVWRDVSALLARVWAWLMTLVAGRSAFDPVAAALVWGLSVWGMSVWAGWTIRRRGDPLLALAPASASLAATLAYTGGGHSSLLMLLWAILFLLACVAYDAQATRWQVTDVAYADLRYEVAVTTIVLSLVLVTAAGAAPSVSIQKIVEYVQGLGDRQAGGIVTVADSLGVERRTQPAVAVFDDLRVTGLPRRHLLGSGPELSRQVVMVIATGDIPAGRPEVVLRHREPPRYYWRSHTYDRYAYWGWFTGETEVIDYEAGEPVITTTLPTQRIVRHEVRIVEDLGGALFAAGELIAADSGYSVAWRSHNDPFGAAIEATEYGVDSLVTEVSQNQLRSAGAEYPEWIVRRYMGLPDTVPERVLALARDLTATAPTPYDRARAVEVYLRQFPYSLDVSTPPAERDVVDYFLFDLQEGYCDYYATAMVVLARAAGLPARLAVGYAAGQYNAISAHYVVTRADAHAWVEIYFPGYGWVDFEPTAGLPAIVRPGEETAGQEPEPIADLGPAIASQGGSGRFWWLVLPGGVALLALVGVAWVIVEGWWLRRLGQARAVTLLYGQLRRHGRWLAVPMRAGDTPYEFAAAIAAWVGTLPGGGRSGRILSPVIHEARQLTDLYVQASYTPRLPDSSAHAQAVRTWQRLRWRLWLAKVWLWRRGRGSRLAR